MECSSPGSPLATWVSGRSPYFALCQGIRVDPLYFHDGDAGRARVLLLVTSTRTEVERAGCSHRASGRPPDPWGGDRYWDANGDRSRTVCRRDDQHASARGCTGSLAQCHTKPCGPTPGCQLCGRYPFGIVGIILSMLLLRRIFHIDPAAEAKSLKKDNEADRQRWCDETCE